jgi:hypothetical protein
LATSDALLARVIPLVYLDGPTIPSAEVVECAQQTGLHEVEQAPEVGKRVLHRCARAGDLEAGLLLLGSLGDQGCGILDALSFVTHHERPRLRSKGELQVAQGLVG